MRVSSGSPTGRAQGPGEPMIYASPSGGSLVLGDVGDDPPAHFRAPPTARSSHDALAVVRQPPSSLGGIVQKGQGHAGAEKAEALPALLPSWGSELAAEAVYCCMSAMAIVFNKHVLSAFYFPAPNALLMFQVGGGRGGRNRTLASGRAFGGFCSGIGVSGGELRACGGS